MHSKKEAFVVSSLGGGSLTNKVYHECPHTIGVGTQISIINSTELEMSQIHNTILFILLVKVVLHSFCGVCCNCEALSSRICTRFSSVCLRKEY